MSIANINKLFNDERLLSYLRKEGYTIKFVPHPNVMPQLEDFVINDCVSIANEEISYQKEFCENKLLITDYSSTFFDFAYLNKPVIYYQYDREKFFAQQIYSQGYYNYDTKGFGPVCMNHEALIDEIIKYIENDFKVEKKYLDRKNEFYAYNDTNNCERIYNEITKL